MERPSKLSADDNPVIIIAEPRFRVLNGLFAAPRIIKMKTGFQVKTKPLNQARVLRAKVWKQETPISLHSQGQQGRLNKCQFCD